jgi:hypothetical protein
MHWNHLHRHHYAPHVSPIALLVAGVVCLVALIEDAADFSVQYRQTYKVVTVQEAYPGGPSERYVLLQCGVSPPRLDGELAGARIVNVPVTRRKRAVA